MVCVGGLTYTIDPTATIGRRMSELELAGKPFDAARTYRVAGWASVNPQPDELAQHLGCPVRISYGHSGNPYRGIESAQGKGGESGSKDNRTLI